MRSLKLLVVVFFFLLSGCSLASRFEREADEVGRREAQYSIVTRNLAAATADRDRLVAAVPQDKKAISLADEEVTRLSRDSAKIQAALIVARDQCEHTRDLLDAQQRNEIFMYRNQGRGGRNLWNHGL